MVLWASFGWSVAEMDDKSNAKAFNLTFDVCVEEAYIVNGG